MLTPPDLPIPYLIDRLAAEFGVLAERLTFLPLGLDGDAAVFRAETGQEAYFLKLRRGRFHPITVELPAYLHRQGLRAIIPPLAARSGQAWAALDDDYRMSLYPYLTGENGYRQALSAAQWREFGESLAQLHATRLPPQLAALLPRETFPGIHRSAARAYLQAADATAFRDPSAAALAADLRGWHKTITAMLDRTDALAQCLIAHPPDFVVCHADMHAGNLHLTPDGRLYIVDWDAPVYAPKERDLLLVGGCPTWSDPRSTDTFYEGYGSHDLHPEALVYYRYQRVIEDIAAFCQQLFDSEEGGDDRPQALRFLRGIFGPGGEVEFAVETDRQLFPA